MTDPIVEPANVRMRKQLDWTFHDLTMWLYGHIRSCEGEAQRAIERGEHRTAALHIAAAEEMSKRVAVLIGPTWRVYAEKHKDELYAPRKKTAEE